MKVLKNEDGQALILTLLSLTLLLGFVGLATDVGTLFYTKRQLQTAADSAAIAGASEVSFTDWAASARADATKNGATSGTNGVTVTVNCPPATGPHAGGACTNYVEVVISQTQNSLFMSLFSTNPVTVAARAVGYLKNNPGCFFTLDPTLNNSFYLNGAALFLTATNCSMYVNSSNVTALNAAGFFNGIHAKSIGIVGNYNHGPFSSITPTPVVGIVPVADPLAYLTPPVGSGCLPSHTNVVVTIASTLSPGNYCGTGGNPAIKLSGPNGSLVTFQAGTYNIDGGGSVAGGLLIQNTAFVTGTGVTFYFKNSATFNISGFGVTLKAPGPLAPYPGILFYQDRADLSNASVGGFINAVDLEGAIYIPSAKLTFPAFIGSTVSNFGIYVAKDIEMQGFIGFLTDYALASGSGGTSPIKAVALVE